MISYPLQLVKHGRIQMLIATKSKQTTVNSIIKTASELILETGNGRIRLQPFKDEMIRVTYTLSEEFPQEQSLGTIPQNTKCHWSSSETDATVTLQTALITVIIQKQTGSFSYYDCRGDLLTKEPCKGGKTLIPFDAYRTILDENSIVDKIVTPDGVKEVVRDAQRVFSKTLYHTRLEFEWADGEALYGLGQQEEGILNLRGTRQYIHQANMKIAMPLFLSTKGYGLLLDTYSPMIFNDNAFGSYLYNEAADALDYYFIYGPSFDEIIRGYRELTGKATMLPKWAFGYMQSQERYENQEEIIETVKAYRQLKIPLDCIVLDWMSWEDGMWGQKSFDAKRFPDPTGMTDTLHEIGVHFMISIWPNMVSACENYTEMKENKGLFQQSETYDAFDENSRSLYWKQVNEGLFSKGIDAWWCDSSEAFTPEWNEEVKPEPDQNYLSFHNTAKIYMDETCTNAFPLVHAKGIYEGQRSVTNEKRVVNLTRSGYTGQQKYGTILWSGDISANWETLRKQIAAGLNFCASGLPYWTLDIGGFFVKKGHMWFWNGDYELGCEDFGYRELYTRWFQFGAFLPVFRAHGTDIRREIWNFGEKGEPFYDTLVAFTELRYRLLPYIYSLAGMVTLKDATIMRLLAFDFPTDPQVYEINDQYLFGNALMICPVTTPMYFGPNSVPIEKCEKSREVYLPSGTKWYDFWTNEELEGGHTITAKAPIDRIPIYVKAGSILPMAAVAQHTGASFEQEIKVFIYPGQEGTFTLYQDEKDNYNYEKGFYTTIDFEWKDKEQVLIIHERKGHYIGMPEVITFHVEIVGIKTYTILSKG